MYRLIDSRGLVLVTPFVDAKSDRADRQDPPGTQDYTGLLSLIRLLGFFISLTLGFIRTFGLCTRLV